MPKISIIVAAYNVEAYLADCLASIGAQTFQDFEAIVVDDASTDSTAQIIEARPPTRTRASSQ
jgi:glycosyltransferase involved in cell wall biosynthesis